MPTRSNSLDKGGKHNNKQNKYRLDKYRRKVIQLAEQVCDPKRGRDFIKAYKRLLKLESYLSAISDQVTELKQGKD